MAETRDLHPANEYQPQKTRTPTEARQGVISGRILTILVTSLALALVAFAILYFANF